MSRRRKEMQQVVSRGGWLAILSDGLLLLLALWGTVCAIFGTLRLPLSLGASLLLSLAASAALAAVFSLPKYRWAVWLALLGLFLVLIRQHWEQLRALYVALLELAPEFTFPWENPLDPATSRTLAMLLMPAMAVLLGWSVVRLHSWWLTALLCSVWWLPGWSYRWLPLMAQCACWLTLLLTALCGRWDPRGEAKMVLVSLPAVLALLLVLSLSVPPSYEGPAWADPLQTRLETMGERLTDGDFLQAFAPQGADVSTRLDNAGPRQPTDDTIMTVTTKVPGRVYLRGTSMAVYTSDAWEPLPDDVYATMGLDQSPTPAQLGGISPLNLAALSMAGQECYEMTIDYGMSLSGVLHTPYQLLTAQDEIDSVDFVNDSYLNRHFGVREKNFYYRPWSVPLGSSVLSTEAVEAERQYRQFVYGYYLTVPDSLYATVETWRGQLWGKIDHDAFYTTVYTAVDPASPYRDQLLMAQIVAYWLQLSTEYDLDTPLTPEGEDFVDYFLNTSCRGYCVHYATAGTLLMRLSGIPARYVTGYTTVVPASGTVEVLDSDAHAWVEIYLDGYGWYPVEMTPPDGTGMDEDPAAPISPVTPDTPEAPEEPAQRPAQQPQTSTAPTAQPDTPEEASRTWLWWLALAAVLCAIPLRAGLTRCIRRRRREKLPANRAVVLLYGYLQRLERFGGEIPESALELARKARFSQHRLREDERGQMIQLAEEQRQQVLAQLSRLKRWAFVWIYGL